MWPVVEIIAVNHSVNDFVALYRSDTEASGCQCSTAEQKATVSRLLIQSHNSLLPQWLTSSWHIKYGAKPPLFIRRYTAMTVDAHITAGQRLGVCVCFHQMLHSD